MNLFVNFLLALFLFFALQIIWDLFSSNKKKALFWFMLILAYVSCILLWRTHVIDLQLFTLLNYLFWAVVFFYGLVYCLLVLFRKEKPKHELPSWLMLIIVVLFLALFAGSIRQIFHSSGSELVELTPILFTSSPFLGFWIWYATIFKRQWHHWAKHLYILTLTFSFTFAFYAAADPKIGLLDFLLLDLAYFIVAAVVLYIYLAFLRKKNSAES